VEALMARVLVVDDDRHVRELVVAVLEDDGHNVRSAENGEEVNGQEFLRRLRAAGLTVPVLVISAYGAQEARDGLGADGALPKPFEIDELVEHVRGLLPAG
jgi:DNA-binding response OmpR family regulator